MSSSNGILNVHASEYVNAECESVPDFDLHSALENLELAGGVHMGPYIKPSRHPSRPWL